MNSNHIRFWELSSGDEIDRQHLEICEECRRQSEVHRLLLIQLSRLPRIEAPPFFAARVQNLISEARPSLVYYFQRMAAQLAPLLTLLILVTSLLIHSVSNEQSGQPGSGGQAAVVLDESAFPEVSVENMIAMPPDLDEGSNR
ncbi:MAG: hypothetical protein EHM61_16295 [Acidobacteria bacterium]|nr:MAG: hypothetical protein EHM61_16295 [Acidobacteriota bacterium]